MEVDGWTGFTDHFTHLKTGDLAKDKTLLMTSLLADGIEEHYTDTAGLTDHVLAWTSRP